MEDELNKTVQLHWRIENIYFCLEKLRSPPIYIDEGSNYIEMYLYLENSEVSFELHGTGTAKLLNWRIKLFIVDNDKLSTMIKEDAFSHDFDKNKVFPLTTLLYQREKSFFRKVAGVELSTIECHLLIKESNVTVPQKYKIVSKVAVNRSIFTVKDAESLSHMALISHSFPPLTKFKFQKGLFSVNSTCRFSYDKETGHNLLVQLKISLLDEKGNIIEMSEYQHVSGKNESTHNSICWGIKMLNNLEKLASDRQINSRHNQLTVKIEIATSDGVPTNQITATMGDLACSKATTMEKNPSFLSEDLNRLYDQQQNADFTLKVGDRDFCVHKPILSARSPVFMAMLTSKMSESVTSSTEIKEFDAHTVEKMLTYIYTDIISDLSCSEATTLYCAADKYQIFSLKKKCSAILKSHLNLRTLCEIIQLSDLYEDISLKKAALGFIALNKNLVLSSMEWKSFEETKPALACRILREILSNA